MCRGTPAPGRRKEGHTRCPQGRGLLHQAGVPTERSSEGAFIPSPDLNACGFQLFMMLNLHKLAGICICYPIVFVTLYYLSVKCPALLDAEGEIVNSTGKISSIYVT